MKKIYSKAEPSLLLHNIVKKKEISKGKIELSDPKEFLQIMAIGDEKDKTYSPHKHIWKEDGKTITQECWVVIQGKLKGSYYDTDGILLTEEILESGDCSVTFYGGHSLEVLEENTIFYEIKTGPYKGKEYDKAKL